MKEPSARSEGASWFSVLSRVVDLGVVLLAPTNELEFANAAACALLGYDGVDELRRNWSEFDRLLEPGFARARAGEHGSSLDIEVTSAAPTRKLRFEIYRLDEPSSEGFLAIIKDREMLDALEDELALAIQMRGLTRFYMEVVHDLKAPLNAMVINLELLKDTLQPDDATRHERQRRYVDVLGEEVQRLNRSLTSLLTQTPRLAESSQRFDVRELIDELASLLAPQAKAQHVNVEATLADEPLPVFARRDRLKQALLNVAINSLEAMPDGGMMSIVVTRDGDVVRIAVRDSGPGIPPELLGRIYAMHFTTKSGGTGIGLYVARSVVMAHHGTIRVDSTVGGGTVVEITLPVAPA